MFADLQRGHRLQGNAEVLQEPLRCTGLPEAGSGSGRIRGDTLRSTAGGSLQRPQESLQLQRPEFLSLLLLQQQQLIRMIMGR